MGSIALCIIAKLIGKHLDDDALLHTIGNPALGEVAIRVYHIDLFGRHAAQVASAPIILGNGTLHERSKKAGVHHIQ